MVILITTYCLVAMVVLFAFLFFRKIIAMVILFFYFLDFTILNFKF